MAGWRAGFYGGLEEESSEPVGRTAWTRLDDAIVLAALYVVFMLPYIGVLAQILAALLGLGAMTMTYLAHRQARQATVVGSTPVSL